MNLFGVLEGREVKEVSMGEYIAYEKTAEKGWRRVGYDEIDGQKVSTVFLIKDHGFDGYGVWFETMIFGGPYDGWMKRYRTYDQAEAGHERTVQALKSGNQEFFE